MLDVLRIWAAWPTCRDVHTGTNIAVVDTRLGIRCLELERPQDAPQRDGDPADPNTLAVTAAAAVGKLVGIDAAPWLPLVAIAAQDNVVWCVVLTTLPC
jgi:hypothetical protein